MRFHDMNIIRTKLVSFWRKLAITGKPLGCCIPLLVLPLPGATTIQAYLNAVGINVDMQGQEYANVVAAGGQPGLRYGAV